MQTWTSRESLLTSRLQEVKPEVNKQSSGKHAYILIHIHTLKTGQWGVCVFFKCKATKYELNTVKFIEGVSFDKNRNSQFQRSLTMREKRKREWGPVFTSPLVTLKNTPHTQQFPGLLLPSTLYCTNTMILRKSRTKEDNKTGQLHLPT